MRLLHVAALFAVLLLTACTPTRPATYQVEPQLAYTLDTGDLVRVTVYGDAALSNTYRVNDAGAIAFPLVGAVQVRGLSGSAAARKLAAALANGFMRNPDVAVEIAEYRPFFIQGEIARSGQFPYMPGMSVRAAISVAGGYTPTADRGRAVLYRRQGSEMARTVVDLDFPILPGDTIVISERWF